MNRKFWFSYLAFVLLLSGVAYVAISDETDMPLVLTDSEMAELRGTGYNERCILNATDGCSSFSCEDAPYGMAQYSHKINACRSYSGYHCSSRGTQTYCTIVYYDSSCSNYQKPYKQTTSDCR